MAPTNLLTSSLISQRSITTANPFSISHITFIAFADSLRTKSQLKPKAMILRGIIPTTPLPSLRLKLKPTRNVTASSSQTTVSKFSISDQELESRGFILRRTISDLDINHLNSVFVAVGFPRRDSDKIRVALENTSSLLWIQYEKTRRPVAFARATGDDIFNAIVWDVVVDPSYQGMGLGKAVMERLIDELLEKGICNIALYSEPRVLGFYRPLGFVADPGGIRGMVYSRKSKNKKL